MNATQGSMPIQKQIVLVGAGNAHLVFLKRWRMKPMPGVAVTLLNESSTMPYSAMVPSHISGEFSREDISLDLVKFCRDAGARLVLGRAQELNPANRWVMVSDRPPLTYDLLSLGLGALPRQVAGAKHQANHGEPNRSLAVRPLATLIQRIEAVESSLKQNPQPFHWVVVGGGASGCETAAAIQKRLARFPGFRLTIFQAQPRLLPGFPASSAAAFARVFSQRGITVRLGTRVVQTDSNGLVLESGEKVPCDQILWATDGTAPNLFEGSGLNRDPQGFLRVRKTLQSTSHPEIFGTGDCVSFEDYPGLPKSGVLAVRQGAVLYGNIRALLMDRPLEEFPPPRQCLYLLNTGDGSAAFNYGPIGWHGRWVRKLKDGIDRRWVDSFHPRVMEPAVSGNETPSTALMRCGGCGSKVSGDVLGAVIKRLAPRADSRVLIGALQGEDAAVFRSHPEGPVEVQTVDYFRSFTDDPYLFGRVAALHAVSDLFAMNARPFAALAIATLPFARGPVQEAQLFELLSGAQRSLEPLGVSLAGGHTTEGQELALGFSVTGLAEEETLFRKGGLEPGDQLILTKPIGTGALLAAWMRSACKASWYESTVDSMLRDNRAAAQVFAKHGVKACTDITGFGLGGHLLEMVDASRVSVRLFGSRVPLLPGFQEVVDSGIVSTLHGDNAKLACRIHGSSSLPGFLFDPQTSGGLLAGVSSEKARRILEDLVEAGCQSAAIIGEVTAAGESPVEVVA